jgi:hypothetical protein
MCGELLEVVLTMRLDKSMITIYAIKDDEVIDGKYLVGETNYRLAIDVLFTLINKLDIQRNLQRSKLYERLGRDLVKGCIMPPLTLAFLNDNRIKNDIKSYERFVNNNITSAFVLDGIQRLNTLNRVFQAQDGTLDVNKPLFVNIIVCNSKDKLLYRMITLNNGQKPMSARHQIEVLADRFLGGNDIPIVIESEKGGSRNGSGRSFKKADIVKAYIAYITGLLNYDNQKIIEEKMDELIAERILEYNVSADSPEFVSVLELISKFVESDVLYEWFQVNNNLIGFSVGIKKSFNKLKLTSTRRFEEVVETFNRAFDSIDVSKIKLGKERRRLAQHFIENYSKTKDYTETDFTADFMDII